jgi:hypothetical protein
VVEGVGLGFHRPAAVVLTDDRDDPGRDRGEQLPTAERGCPAVNVAFHVVCPRVRESADLIRPLPGFLDPVPGSIRDPAQPFRSLSSIAAHAADQP